jgi:uncharacterized membrane protein YphA (DoxX/SURF4 family)
MVDMLRNAEWTLQLWKTTGSMAGGLLQVAAFGAGRFSLDARHR